MGTHWPGHGCRDIVCGSDQIYGPALTLPHILTPTLHRHVETLRSPPHKPHVTGNESRDSKLGPANVCPQPLWGHDGVPHYEIKRICNARCHKGVDELWVEWQGYDQSHNGWVARSSLLQDVPHLVHAFEANPSVFKARKSAPMRASTAVRDSVLPPPPPALPVAPLHPPQVRSAVVVRKHNSVGVVVSRQLPQPLPTLLISNRQSHLIGRAAIARNLRGAGVVVSRRSTLRSGSSRGGRRRGGGKKVTFGRGVGGQKTRAHPLMGLLFHIFSWYT